jgi:RNA-dependent RNA polymerase
MLRLNNHRFLNLTSLLKSVATEIHGDHRQEIDLFSANMKVSLIRRATVTPTKVILYFPEPNISNRVTRKFGAENFLRLRFRDEDLRTLNISSGPKYASMNALYARIQQFLNTEFSMCERGYVFLAMSASQLREHGCWLYAPPINGMSGSCAVTADKVREFMGDFREIRNIGKYAARLGQGLSSSIETGQVEKSEFCIIKDITVPFTFTNGVTVTYTFTDGIGKISKEKADEISKMCFKNKYFSACQIRYAGFKGVLAVDPTLSSHQIQFRPSMNKFDSKYSKLDVLNIAEYIPCYLNRQIIIILSCLGIPDEAFVKLQNRMVSEMSGMFIERATAERYLLQYYHSGTFCSGMNEFGIRFNYTFEPFYRSLLKTIYQKLLQDLIKKSRIFVG